MTSGMNTKEYVRLRENFSYVSEGIEDHVESLAQGLFEVKIISSVARDEASYVYTPKQRRASTLISLVSTRVSLESSQFYVFLDVLRKDPILDAIVKRLEFKGRIFKLAN